MYVIPPSQSLGMVDGHLVLSPLQRVEERRAPIDIFFRTLAEAHGRRAVSVVLSGTGADGSMGMKRVKECGGACFVQDPAEAEHADMPRACIATALVDQVLEVGRIPEKIVAYQQSLREISLPDRPDEPIESDDEGLRERIPYMYIPPQRLAGRSLREAIAPSAGLRLIARHAMPSVSLSQLKHEVLVFEKAA